MATTTTTTTSSSSAAPPTTTPNHTYIKRIIIKGFKSYKDQSEFEPFSPHCNVIVGKNGTGKSNFFFAIRFVLSDMYASLRADERQALLHESVGETVMSAFVEIHFDNRDNRFPVDKEEVIIRRAIGLKKDEYFLDRKHVSKADIVNLLESAGFSRANPYYIVQQGKVNALTLMKDSERLELLKEVAGTRVYDERKEESMKIMRESDLKLEKIEEVLKYIHERLEELEEEKEELKEYQQLDRDKRCIEYTLYTKEFNNAQEKLEKLETDRVQESERATNVHKEAVKAHERLKTLEKEFRAASAQLTRTNASKTQTEDERQDNIRLRARLELNLHDSEEKHNRNQERHGKLKEEIDTITKRIKDTEKKLEGVKAKYQENLREEATITERIQSFEHRLTELYSKQGRKEQFSSKKERDTHIQNEIKALKKSISQQNDQVDKMRANIAQLSKTIANEEKDLSSKAGDLEESKAAMDRALKALNDAKSKRDEASNTRKDHWKKEHDLNIQAQSIRTELVKAEHSLKGTVSKNITAGLAAVNRIARDYKDRIKGAVYGPLIELLETNREYMTAIEVTAGNSIFNVVVDTEETASRIMDIMNEEKAPRATLMPLDRIIAKETNLPTNNDVAPIISHIRFKPMFKKAFLHVFGKTLICKNLDIASTFAKSHDVNCVTLQGDQVNRKGALTGGFYDTRYSKLEHMKNIKEWKQKLDQFDGEADKVKALLVSSEREVNASMAEMQQEETKRNKAKNAYELQSLEIQQRRRELEAKRELLEQNQRTLLSLESSLKQSQDKTRAYEEELHTELNSQLTNSEQNEVPKLTEELRTLKEQKAQISEQRSTTEGQQNELKELISSNLAKRRDALSEEMQSISLNEDKLELEAVQREYEAITSNLETITERLEELDKLIKQETANTEALKTEIDEAKQKEHENTTTMTDENKVLEKILHQRALLIQKREEVTRKIRELGTLPSEAAEKYKNEGLRELMKKLHEVNVGLKKYDLVNKKALDQYVSFTDQRERLLERKKEIDEGASAISDLIKVLDQRKDEAIERTFKGVAKHFSDVFKELVPEGKATLRILRGRSDEQEGEDSQQQQQQSKVLQYTGVSIRVSFSGPEETQLMQQLSGGQKSLVALSLIFAIQRADPAPFYLFDEIDSALDPMYRKAVADMIKNQSKNTQFVLTTFKPELVTIAKKWYGIKFKNGVSTINSISRNDALRILEVSLPTETGGDVDGEEHEIDHEDEEEEEEEEVEEGEEGER